MLWIQADSSCCILRVSFQGFSSSSLIKHATQYLHNCLITQAAQHDHIHSSSIFVICPALESPSVLESLNAYSPRQDVSPQWSDWPLVNQGKFSPNIIMESERNRKPIVVGLNMKMNVYVRLAMHALIMGEWKWNTGWLSCDPAAEPGHMSQHMSPPPQRHPENKPHTETVCDTVSLHQSHSLLSVSVKMVIIRPSCFKVLNTNSHFHWFAFCHINLIYFLVAFYVLDCSEVKRKLYRFCIPWQLSVAPSLRRCFNQLCTSRPGISSQPSRSTMPCFSTPESN